MNASSEKARRLVTILGLARLHPSRTAVGQQRVVVLCRESGGWKAPRSQRGSAHLRAVGVGRIPIKACPSPPARHSAPPWNLRRSDCVAATRLALRARLGAEAEGSSGGQARSGQPPGRGGKRSGRRAPAGAGHRRPPRTAGQWDSPPRLPARRGSSVREDPLDQGAATAGSGGANARAATGSPIPEEPLSRTCSSSGVEACVPAPPRARSTRARCCAAAFRSARPAAARTPRCGNSDNEQLA